MARRKRMAGGEQGGPPGGKGPGGEPGSPLDGGDGRPQGPLRMLLDRLESMDLEKLALSVEENSDLLPGDSRGPLEGRE